jgi:hypothetical protein
MLPGKTFGSYVTPEVWAITTNTTVAEIKDGSSTYLTGDLKTAKQDDDDNAKTFRGRGFGKSLAVMKQWVDDADKMEAEAEEKDAEEDSGGGLNPKPKMKDVTIKKGSAVLAEGKSGDYDRKSKILVAELTWKKGIQALDFLQQKLSVTASAVNKEDGELKSDMKLDKLSGDFKKATFKG